jgi:3-(3-hydroxy-phenyl)propionate hydroxylase
VNFDVAIVGFGPTGATLANLLGLQGMKVAVVEREATPPPLPRAVHFDGEVMRIFETAGLAQEILPLTRPSGGMRYVNTAGHVMIERQPAVGSGPHGWANNYLFHHPDLEAVLRGGVKRFPGVQVFLGEEVVSVAQDSLQTARRSIGARHIVGCDGARSIVRQAIGSEHDDLGLHQPWLVVDVLLQREVDLPLQTVQFCDPARPITFVKVTGKRRRWEIMLMPGDAAESMAQPDTVWRLLAPWIRPGDAILERAAVYTFHSLIARKWRDRRLFIAGDAAHQTPPFLGQGMCAGIRDAANLAWKLAAETHFGSAHLGPALLDTYQSEREPHVRIYIEEALRLGAIIQTTDPKVAAERDRRFLATGKEEMVNLSPRLGPGFHREGGEIFPQALLPDGRRLDQAIGGYRFAVLCPERLRVDSPFPVVPFEGEEAIVLRPDRYVYARARSAAELESLIGGMRHEPQAA